MSDIFKANQIFPPEGKIKDHFKTIFDEVFVALMPFFKMKNHHKDFPADEEIFKTGKIMSWKTICDATGLKDYAELNKALRTSTGALRPIFQQPELLEKLNRFTEGQSIWYPTAGSFDVFSKVAIYKTFKRFGNNKIVVTDEFYDKTFNLEIGELTDFEFSKKIGFKDYYIYDADREILFAISWDRFFFLIATDQEKMRRITASNLFEGFLCNEKTHLYWEYKKDDLQELLDKEKQPKIQTGNLEEDQYFSLQLLSYDQPNEQTGRYYFHEMSTLQATTLLAKEQKIKSAKIIAITDDDKYLESQTVKSFNPLMISTNFF